MIARLAGHFLTPQFVRFMAVGGIAAFAQWASRFVFDQWMDYRWAVVAAFGIGLTCGYVLNAVFVFPQSGRSRWAEVFYFSLFNLLSLPLIWGVSVGLGLYVLPQAMDRGVAKAVGNGIGILTPVAINFLLHKRFTFKAR